MEPGGVDATMVCVHNWSESVKVTFQMSSFVFVLGFSALSGHSSDCSFVYQKTAALFYVGLGGDCTWKGATR